MLRDEEGKPLREDTGRREKTGRQEKLTQGMGDYRRKKFKIEDLKKMKEKERRYKKKLRKISQELTMKLEKEF